MRSNPGDKQFYEGWRAAKDRKVRMSPYELRCFEDYEWLRGYDFWLAGGVL